MRISDWSSDVCSSDLGVEHAFLHRFRDRRMREDSVHQILFGRLEIHRDDEALDQFGDFRADHVGAEEFARSEEHTSELQSLMRISYAVFCLKKKNSTTQLSRTITRRPQTHARC